MQNASKIIMPFHRLFATSIYNVTCSFDFSSSSSGGRERGREEKKVDIVILVSYFLGTDEPSLDVRSVYNESIVSYISAIMHAGKYCEKHRELLLDKSEQQCKECKKFDVIEAALRGFRDVTYYGVANARGSYDNGFTFYNLTLLV